MIRRDVYLAAKMMHAAFRANIYIMATSRKWSVL